MPPNHPCPAPSLPRPTSAVPRASTTVRSRTMYCTARPPPPGPCAPAVARRSVMGQGEPHIWPRNRLCSDMVWCASCVRPGPAQRRGSSASAVAAGRDWLPPCSERPETAPSGGGVAGGSSSNNRAVRQPFLLICAHVEKGEAPRRSTPLSSRLAAARRCVRGPGCAVAQ